MTKYKTGSALIRLANEVDLPNLYRPGWLREDVEPTRAVLELGYCMDGNPGPFDFGDIASAVMTEIEPYDDDTAEYPIGHGDRSYVWEVVLTDGRKYHVEGWHDYTGWGCQDGATYTEVVS